MMRCEKCDRIVDTDEDLEGLWSDFGYICTRCCEDQAEEDEETK